MTKMTKKNLIPLSEAAKITGFCPQYLRRLCRNGKLSFYVFGARYMFTQKDLDHLIVRVEAKNTGSEKPTASRG